MNSIETFPNSWEDSVLDPEWLYGINVVSVTLCISLRIVSSVELAVPEDVAGLSLPLSFSPSNFGMSVVGTECLSECLICVVTLLVVCNLDTTSAKTF